MNEMEQKVLKTLSHQYKNIAAASTEIINLQSILNLPKGTEHFLTDIHGEYEQFNHVLKTVPVPYAARSTRNSATPSATRTKKPGKP